MGLEPVTWVTFEAIPHQLRHDPSVTRVFLINYLMRHILLLRTLLAKRSFILKISLATLPIYTANRKTQYNCEATTVKASPLIVREEPSIRQVLKLLRKHLLLAFAAAGSAVLAAISTILSPIYVAKVIDVLTSGIFDGSQFQNGVLSLLGVSVANALFTWLYIKLVGELGEVIAKDLRVRLFEQLLDESVAFFDSHSVAELLSRLNVDVQEFKHSLKAILTTGLKTSVQLASSVGQMIVLSPKLTLTLSSGLPFIFAVGSAYGRFLRLLSGEARVVEAEAANVALEAFSNVRTVKAFCAEDYELQKYQGKITDYSRRNSALLSHIGIFEGLTSLSTTICTAAVMYFGGREVLEGNLSGGQLMAFLMTLQTAQKAVTGLVTLSVKLQNMTGAFDRLKLKQVKYDEQAMKISLSGRVNMEKVTFRYPNRIENTLENFNLDIKAGEFVAIIGESGSGKSTIAALLERFYEPQSGTISFDSVESSLIDKKNLLTQVGYVPQEPIIFSGSVRDNICFGRSIPDEDVISAAKSAHIHDVIEALPQGYDTEIAKVSLSGGQKQRIAIARAIVAKPKILILDEATSALDYLTEGVIFRTILELEEKCTIIMITHKHDHLKHADRIINM